MSTNPSSSTPAGEPAAGSSAREAPPDEVTANRPPDASAPDTTADDGPSRFAPVRRSVASYETYQQAERAVDWLSDERFPVRRVAIVGSGLRTVEQVTGRITTANAAGQGAVQGAIIGVFLAVLFGLFFTGPAFFGLLLYAVLLSAAIGAALGAIAHATLGGRRDFGTVPSMQADRYDVMVDHEVADEAEQLLARLPAAAAR